MSLFKMITAGVVAVGAIAAAAVAINKYVEYRGVKAVTETLKAQNDKLEADLAELYAEHLAAMAKIAAENIARMTEAAEQIKSMEAQPGIADEINALITDVKKNFKDAK